MLEEIKYDFVGLLHKKLKEKIRAGIVVKINQSDKLIVEIYRDREVDYLYIMDGFSDRFYNGLNTDQIVHDIVTGYRIRVIAKHFY